MDNYIAVFTRTEGEFKNNFRFRPVNKFIRIRDIEDLRGRTFIGVIRYITFLDAGVKIKGAYAYLQERHPELFKE